MTCNLRIIILFWLLISLTYLTIWLWLLVISLKNLGHNLRLFSQLIRLVSHTYTYSFWPSCCSINTHHKILGLSFWRLIPRMQFSMYFEIIYLEVWRFLRNIQRREIVTLKRLISVKQLFPLILPSDDVLLIYSSEQNGNIQDNSGNLNCNIHNAKLFLVYTANSTWCTWWSYICCGSFLWETV